MISLEQRTMGVNNAPAPIQTFAVWWRTPLGLTDDLSLAIARCNDCDFDPDRMIVPVVVAIDDNGNYEEFVR